MTTEALNPGEGWEKYPMDGEYPTHRRRLIEYDESNRAVNIWVAALELPTDGVYVILVDLKLPRSFRGATRWYTTTGINWVSMPPMFTAELPSPQVVTRLSLARGITGFQIIAGPVTDG